MSLVAQCLQGSAPVARSQSRIRLKARENKVLAPLQANNARSEGLNGRPSADRSSKSRVAQSQRQLSPQRARAGLPKPSQHRNQAGGWTGTAMQR
ncbi:hypothetical protein HaLaN_30847 [Haematococcus lacustris]|uniref:Uncharacterized protein n=1 Tax=Haematococcus lacustris TaxID=44745 RepID=A0A6A0AI68_HAELA|nr:hypothetical protein HaLaN_30840 [Haematococcus lacustris]GFH31744.1 hypothetical protein HaLaN_30847 [Haematococcus lacustris]